MKAPIDKLLDTVKWQPIERGSDFVPGGIPYATHMGVLNIMGCELECVVLNTGERLFTEEGLRKFFGPAWDELKEAAAIKAGEGKK